MIVTDPMTLATSVFVQYIAMLTIDFLSLQLYTWQVTGFLGSMTLK